uniref:Reverse transcriptase domain-containing protein n=1 Tax=Loa loa TaxID=7209 RepID=A0A1I7VYK0_LOALO
MDEVPIVTVKSTTPIHKTIYSHVLQHVTIQVHGTIYVKSYSTPWGTYTKMLHIQRHTNYGSKRLECMPLWNGIINNLFSGTTIPELQAQHTKRTGSPLTPITVPMLIPRTINPHADQ